MKGPAHMYEASVVSSVRCALGEGPVWSIRDQTLWFLDIKNRTIFSYQPSTRRERSWEIPEEPGFILPTQTGKIVGLPRRLCTFDPETGSLSLLHEVEQDPSNNRLNDASVSYDGTIWFGSMDKNCALPTGQLMRYDGSNVTVVGGGMICVNGPNLCPLTRTFYVTDTYARRIYANDYRDGIFTNKRVFLDLSPSWGYPDGTTLDAEGGLWIGFYFGGCVRRFDSMGKLTHTVQFPVSNVTKIALGGPDLRTAYATTAWDGLDAVARNAEPLAGALFAFEVEIPGIAAHGADIV